ncbi:alpha/beta-hydrolase [Thelephora ganbajun]|uniref:Alpha/beta-hydrolase n=1 Tax=Thelephora ganbajun TaxID=370292 RepID=A0ACB6ZVR2_THEGA|nr:alpha/beta-hydrolase [Thelephora ganbajun]
MLLFTLAITLLSGFAVAQFPLIGKHRTARCPAVNRATDETKAIDIHYVEVNPRAKDTLIFVHGWPGIWSIWKHQINEFKNDYRVVVVDVRGMGASGHPGDVEGSSSTGDFVDDLVCVLKHAEVAGKSVCIGHDWGSSICWEAGRARPDIFSGVISLAVPYLASAGPYTPIEAFLKTFPRLTYQVYFRDTIDNAAAELEADVRRTIRIVYKHSNTTAPDTFLTSSTSFLTPYDGIELSRSPLMTQEEEDYLVDQFTKSGFKNSLQFYQHRNRYLSWQIAHDNGTFNVNVPSLAIYPNKDSVADWNVVSEIAKSKSFVPQLEEVSVPTAHCPHMERPKEINAYLGDWLTRTFPSSRGTFEKAEGEL